MRKGIVIVVSILALLILVASLLAWKYTDNTTLQVTDYQIFSEKIPLDFDGFRIAQIADLHNTEFGTENSDLLTLLEESNPDIIVFTGDQVDARRTDIETVINFARKAVQIAPCYLVNGNHEGSIVQLTELRNALESLGVTLLEDEVVQIQQNNAALTLIGVNDPTLSPWYFECGFEGSVDAALTELSWDSDNYSILLSHHPEYLQTYAKHGLDLVLCGHAHGGQIRIGKQGIIAPHQGLFPKYDAGCYKTDNTTMVLSRGLGNSLFPWRINNPPELVVLELRTGQ